MYYSRIAKRHARIKDMTKFKIPAIPKTTNKTIRFPNDLIENVERAIADDGTECTFSAFVIEAVKVALRNLEEETQQI